MVPVVAADDPRLADYSAMKAHATGRRTDESFFVVEGHLLIERLIASDFQVRSILVERGRDPSKIGPVPSQVPIYEVPSETICKIAGFKFHRGFLASATRRPLLSLDQYLPDPVSLACVQISDMENLGSMLRSAAAFGIRQVLIDRQSVDVDSRRVMRVSMGAGFGMRFIEMPSPAEDLQTLSERGVLSLATSLADDSVSLDHVALPNQPTLIVMGNEARGLPRRVQAAASRRVKIPIHAVDGSEQLIDSLNVSVAAAIVMHEVTRRIHRANEHPFQVNE